jgi:hypothetical protein
MTGPANADRALAELAINVAAEKAALDKCLSEEHDTFTVGDMLTHMAHIQDAQNAYTDALEAALTQANRQREAATRALEDIRELTEPAKHGLNKLATVNRIVVAALATANTADDAGAGAEGE